MNHSLTVTRLLTRKNALQQRRVETRQVDLPLIHGDALLKIARVAITTNNITY